MSQTAPFPFAPLLPLRALAVTLEFTGEAQLGFFHQAAVHAFVRHLAGSPDAFHTLITIDAPESGRGDYRAGERYRFAVYGLPGSEAALARLLTGLRGLPGAAPRTDSRVPLRNNLRLAGLHDLFSEEPVQGIAELTRYDLERLLAETELWSAAPGILLRWLSPVRLDRGQGRGNPPDPAPAPGQTPTKPRGQPRPTGEARFCHCAEDLADGLLPRRLYDAAASLLRERGGTAPARQVPTGLPAPAGHLFWVDSDYRDAAGRPSPVGGLAGELALGPAAAIPPDWLRLLVLGQYLGIGERRALGLGRYRLETPDGAATAPSVAPAASLLAQAAREDNLYAAYRAIRDNQTRKDAARRDAPRGAPAPWSDTELWDADYPDPPDPDAECELADRLERLGNRLREGDYQPPALTGVVSRESDGDLRGLAIPPFWDRVVQRALVQRLAPAMEPLFSAASHGYRPGHSRHSASDAIQRAWREGYRWVYEADIDDFFDSLDWQRLAERLRALYRDDPAVELLLAWIAAPVDYQGLRLERTRGLPQGAPLSPLLANLMLDDLVIDTAGQPRPPGAPKPPSPNSWLARLARRAPTALTADTLPAPSLRPERRNPGQERQPADRPGLAEHHESAAAVTTGTTPQARAGLGQLADEGQLLILTGAPVLVSTSTGRLIATRDDQTIAATPWRQLQAVVCFGAHHVTTPALRAAFAHRVPIHFASGGGTYQGSAWSGQPAAEGAGLWLEQQARCTDPAWAIPAAREIVIARVRHQRELLRQRQPAGFQKERQTLQQAAHDAASAPDLSTLNGIEGAAARVYFQALAPTIPAAYGFDGRNRRPPRDPFNALLSLGYTLLHAHVDTLIRAAGLYPWIGFYHQPHGRHAALASDLMEPFRHLIERAALRAVTRQGIGPDAFHLDPVLGCRLSPPALRRYLAMIWERLEAPAESLEEGESRPAIHQIHRQNRRLVEAIRTGAPLRPWVAR